MVTPAVEGCFTLAELRASGLGPQVIDALVNVRKLLAWESLACQKAAGRASHLRNSREWDVTMDSHYKRLVEAEEDQQASEEHLSAAE